MSVEDEPTEYPQVAPSTVKQLYGTAYRCAYPDCSKPLYRVHEMTGEPILNSRIAHIHSRRRGGPRWKIMDPDENRAYSNLLLLCIEHSYEIDGSALAESYPAEILHAWKDAQIREHQENERAWPISDADAEKVIAASAATASVSADAVVGVARTVARVLRTARDSRTPVATEVALWLRTVERTRASLYSWDAETGERLYADPPRIETDRHRQAVCAALNAALTVTQTAVTDAEAELAAVRAASSPLRPWCDAVSRLLETVLAAAARWPEPPPFEDDPQFEESLHQLENTVDTLTAKWRGEDVPTPVEPAPHAAPIESSDARKLREHDDLLERARRHSRAKGLAYDRDLALLLFDALSFAATIPHVFTLLPYGLAATSGLIAGVARNADDDAFRELIHRCRRASTLTGLFVVRELHIVANEQARTNLADEAKKAAVDLATSADWANRAVWDEAAACGRELLSVVASLTSAEATRSRLEDALRGAVGLLPAVILGCAEWTEQRDSRDLREVRGWSRQYSRLPVWFPTAVLVNAIRVTLPDVLAQGEPRGTSHPYDVESLAAQILYLAASDLTNP